MQGDSYWSWRSTDSRLSENLAERPDAGDCRSRADWWWLAAGDLRVRSHHGISRREERKVLAEGTAQEIRCRAMDVLADGQPRTEDGRAGTLSAHCPSREKRRSGLCVAALRQRSTSHLRSDESRTAQEEVSRRGRIHDRRHDLLSVGDNLAESQSRPWRISQC